MERGERGLLKELWKDWMFIVDYFLLAVQSDVLLITYIVIGFFVLYTIFHPVVRFIMALEWTTFMTYLLVILAMFLFLHFIPQANNVKFVIYAMLIFSIIISSRRGITLIKQHKKTN